MRVAITGVSGFIGAELARVLVERGHTVVGLVRTTSRRDHIEGLVERFVVGDQADRARWDELLDGVDGVIHNAFDWDALKSGDLARHLDANLSASIELLTRSAPRPFVYMSSIAVHHDMSPRWEGLIDEEHPLRPGGLYGAAKAAVEAHLWADWAASQRHVAAIRPAGVYGLDPKLERSIGHPIIERLRKSARFTRAGGGKFVHVRDVAEASVAALERPDAAGRPFNMAECYARWADWAQLASDLLGIEAEIDFSSPAAPKNTFSCDAVRSCLGVPMDRGHEGIRDHLRALIGAMNA